MGAVSSDARSELSQEAYVKASNTDAGDDFGFSVALSGDTLVVGAPGEDSSGLGPNEGQGDNTREDSGAVYVFVRSGGTWALQAYLKASNPGAGDAFGFSVDIDGDTLVVGARGEASNGTGVNGAQGDNSAPNAGAAYVFFRLGSIWGQQAYLKASNTGRGGANFGTSVAVSGDLVVVGAPSEGGASQGVDGDDNNFGLTGSGAAYVFVRNGFNWTHQAYLKASNTGELDAFGRTVAISGQTILVGASFEDSGATGVNGSQSSNSAPDSGAAYVFQFANNAWTQQAYLKASNTGSGDFFGISVDLDGDTALIGAREEDGANPGVGSAGSNNGASNSGAAYVFTREGVVWTQQASLKSSRPQENDRFGFSVGLSGDEAIVGAIGEDRSATGLNGDQVNGNAFNSGAAYRFVRSGDIWREADYMKASNTGASDCFGASVCVDGDLFACGAAAVFLTGDFGEILFGEDGAATGINGDETSDGADGSGAVYAFRFSPPPLPPSPPAPRIAAAGRRVVVTSRPKVVLRGTSTDADQVEFKIRAAGFRPARGPVARWNIPLRITANRTVVVVRARGAGGLSRNLRFTVRRRG